MEGLTRMNKENRRPNIVMITADQWRGDCIGVYQNRHPVMTPHLNQLAAEGVMFTQAYADCPVCMPQRVTLLTGKAASRTGVKRNSKERLPIDSRTSLPGLLTREGGYQTKAIGKMHFNPDRARFGFEHVTLLPEDYVNWLENTEYAGLYRGHGLGGNETYPSVSPVPERFTHTHWVVDEGIKFLGQRDPETPFFLWMVFEAPHSPFDPPEPFDRMYDNITVSDPVNGEWVENSDIPYLANRKVYHKNKYNHMTDEMVRETKRKYYGQVTHIDYQLGRLFGELYSKGLYENTIIVFTSDHGEHLGDHQMFGKATYLNSSANVPLIIRVPESVLLARHGMEIVAPVLTADIYPTLLELAGIKPADEIDGISLTQQIATGLGNENRIVCGEFGEEAGTSFASDGQFKYIYYNNGGKEQLFDAIHDVDDLIDLSEKPEYREVKEKLRNKLEAYLSRFNSSKVSNGKFIKTDIKPNDNAFKGINPFAVRGPLRYGQGYGKF